MPKLPFPVRSRIVKNYFAGRGRNENFRKIRRNRESLSPSSVSAAINEFYDQVENGGGIVMVANVYGVREEIDELRDIAKFAHENRIERNEMQRVPSFQNN